MLDQEMPERPEKIIVPIFELQNGAEHRLEATIFIAGNAERPGHVIQITH